MTERKVFWPEHDKLLHAATGCADTVEVYAAEALNSTQIMLEGATPTGQDKKGWPTWKKAHPIFKCVVSMADYKAASERQKAATKAEQSSDLFAKASP